MVEGVIDRKGTKYTIQEALDISEHIGYPKAYIQAVVDHAQREYKGAVHVTDIIGCLKRNVLRKKYPYYVDLEKASNTMVGTSLHDYMSSGDTEHRLSYDHGGVEITGSVDMVELHNDGFVLWDLKGVKSFKVMKTLGLYKKDVPILNEDGQPVYYKSGKKTGQAKTRKEVYQSRDMRDAHDYEAQMNAYRVMLLDQIKRGADKVYNKEEHDFDVIALKIFFMIKDFGKESSMAGINSNTVVAPLDIWEKTKTFAFFDRAWIFDKAMKEDYIPECPTSPVDTWDGRMCDGFCEFRDRCSCFGGNL